MRRAVTTVILICLSALAGVASEWVGLPLPYLLGPLCLTALIATALPASLPTGYTFPGWLRAIFIAIIGLMIGAQVTADLFVGAEPLVISLLALIPFVALALACNYLIFRKLGGYDRATAFYASTPGGLYESLSMGESAGADMPRLILQQFLRIIVVVTILPIGLSLWLGAPVGSAGGMTLARPTVPFQALLPVVFAGLLGMFAGKALRMPAGPLTGPMAVAAALSLSGLVPLNVPQWLVNDAQIVIGTALGMRFTGLSRALILRGLGLSLLSVGGMLVVAAAFAVILAPMAGQDFDVMLISYAPGGVTEMALVALSLQANPAFVTLHHIVRILLTVIGLGLSARWLQRPL